MRQTILGVFAHPDDEIALSGLFYRAKKLGMETHLICATRGEAARIRHPEIVTIETQAEVRTKEIENVCELLGVSTLNFLELPDNKANTWSEYNIKEKLLNYFNNIKPNIVITFDANGGNGHPDHKEISRLTLSVFEQYRRDGDQELYYATLFPRTFVKKRLYFLPISRKVKNKMLQRFTVPDDDVTVMIKLKKDELRQKLNSAKCHKSQFPDEKGNYYKIPFYLFKRCSKYENYCYYKKHEAGNKLKALL